MSDKDKQELVMKILKFCPTCNVVYFGCKICEPCSATYQNKIIELVEISLSKEFDSA